MKKETRIIVVDDHEIFRKGLITTINRLKNTKIIAESSNGEDLLDLLDKYPDADMVFMDIEMPGINGIETTKKALDKNPNLKIIALSMFVDDNYVQNMIDAGAKGYLIKNITKEGLEKAITLISQGQNYFSEELWTFFTKKMAPKEDKEQFTKREIEVLALICEGMSNDEIAEELFISERTVIGHKSKLLAKTGCKNSVQLVAHAMKNKLVDK
jgi:DNA-binding NarL/FixJ family response regulator